MQSPHGNGLLTGNLRMGYMSRQRQPALEKKRMASADATQTARKDLFQSTIYGGKTIVKYLIHEAH